MTDAKSLKICVFCGSSPGTNPAHMKLAAELGEEIAHRGHSLVYGGGGLGLMGAAARAARDSGAKVIGIIPHFLNAIERTNMHARKMRMFDLADAFIILPGGIGTLEEVTEVMSWQRLNLHDKPIYWMTLSWPNLRLRHYTQILSLIGRLVPHLRRLKGV